MSDFLKWNLDVVYAVHEYSGFCFIQYLSEQTVQHVGLCSLQWAGIPDSAYLVPLGLPSLLLGPQSANWAGKVFLLVPLNRQRVPGSLRQRGFLDWVTYLRQVSISKYVTSFLCLDFEYWCHNTCALIVHVILAHTCSLLSALFSSLSGHYAAGMRQVALLLRWLHVSK